MFWTAAIAMAVSLGLSAPSAEAQPSPCNGAPPCENWMSVSSAGPAPVGTTVTVNLSIDLATTPYQAYDAAIEYDSAVVSFSIVQFGWGSPCMLPPCWEDVSTGGSLRETRLWAGLASGTTTGIGVVAQVDYHCVGGGTTTLRLVSPTEDPLGTTTYGASGEVIPTGLTAGSITCEALVGGIAELPSLALSAVDETAVPADHPGWSAGSLPALVVVGLAAAAIIGTSGWYARRHWLR
jgi:hypothetical protein